MRKGKITDRRAESVTATVLSAALALFAAAAFAGERLSPAARAQEIAANASGCVATTLSCGQRLTGALAPGDCTLSDGTYYDVFRFNGTAGQVVTAFMRPLSATFTKPGLLIMPPASDSSKTPAVYGGAETQVSYKLASSGSWSIAVVTEDPFATGSYVVDLSCGGSATQPANQNCVVQTLSCKQNARWYMTNQSCRFSNNSSIYQDFKFYGLAGQLVDVFMISADFIPSFAVWSEALRKYIDIDGQYFYSAGNSKLQETLRLPATGQYRIIASPHDDFKVGFFVLSLECISDGCLSPLLLTQPPATQTVAAGSSVTLVFPEVSGSAPVARKWVDRVGIVQSLSGTFTTGPLTQSATFYAYASNACGEEISKPLFLNVIGSARRHAAKK